MTTTPQLLDIDVDQLEPDPHNIRKSYDEEIIAGLATFFRNEGRFIEHPVVWEEGMLPDGRPRYRAYSGSTRAQAAQRVGGKLTVIVLREQPDSLSKVRGQLSAAALKKDLSPLEIAKALEAIQDEAEDRRGKLSLRDIKNELEDIGLKRDRAWISNHLRILQTEPEVQQLFDCGAVPVDAVGLVLSVKGAAQVELAERISRGWDWRSARSQHEAGALDAMQEVDESVRQAAAQFEQGSKRRTGPDADRRSGAVESRYLLLGVASPQALAAPARRSRRVQVIPEEWAQHASNEAKAIAAEVSALSPRRTDKEVVDLVEQLFVEANDLPEPLFRTLNALRQLLDLVTEQQGALRSHPAARELARLRCDAFLKATGSSTR